MHVKSLTDVFECTGFINEKHVARKLTIINNDKNYDHFRFLYGICEAGYF